MILAVRVLSKRTERSSVPVFVVMPAAAFDVNVFPNAAGVFPDIRLRDLAFFHHDVPIGVALAAEYQIHVAPVRLIKLKAAVFFYKLKKRSSNITCPHKLICR